ncbi:MAG: hypothetical protein ACLTM8_10515 [Veillonella parvula]
MSEFKELTKKTIKTIKDDGLMSARRAKNYIQTITLAGKDAKNRGYLEMCI